MKKILFLVLSLIFSACERNTNDSSRNIDSDQITPESHVLNIEPKITEAKIIKYNIFDKIKLETHNKAQVLSYAYTEQIPKTQDELENVLKDIYGKTKSESGYKNFDKPTVVGAYVFTSEKLAKQDKSAWIGMISKGPNDTEPRITINDLKLKSLIGLENNEKSEDEIELEKINKNLSKRGLELCSFNKKLSNIELECIHKADRKYPDFGMEHMKYVDKLTEIEFSKIKKKYRINDDIFSEISIFASSYCK